MQIVDVDHVQPAANGQRLVVQLLIGGRSVFGHQLVEQPHVLIKERRFYYHAEKKRNYVCELLWAILRSGHRSLGSVPVRLRPC